MKTIPEDELLALIGKTDIEIHNFCVRNHIIHTKRKCPVCKCCMCESFADLAERLWEKADILTIHPLATVYEHLFKIEVTQETRAAFVEWWAWSAKPIHRIVAAIIALQRAGVEI